MFQSLVGLEKVRRRPWDRSFPERTLRAPGVYAIVQFSLD